MEWKRENTKSSRLPLEDRQKNESCQDWIDLIQIFYYIFVVSYGGREVSGMKIKLSLYGIYQIYFWSGYFALYIYIYYVPYSKNIMERESCFGAKDRIWGLTHARQVLYC